MFEITSSFLQLIPKIDLHFHLDGSLRASTVRDLARRINYPLPTEDLSELRKRITVPINCNSLTEFLNCFFNFYDLLKNPFAVERMAFEAVEDAYNQNIKYIEIRFAPQLQAEGDFTAEKVLQAAFRGIERAMSVFDVEAKLILCLFRSHSIEKNMEVVYLADKYRSRGVVAIDLAGDESRYPVELYSECFKEAVKLGIPITIHAGEAAGADSIRNAINLGATRIGHGTRLYEDRELMQYVKKNRIGLEVCLTSNLHTAVVRNIEEHPVKEYMNEGLCVTLNTDDPGISEIDLTHEYRVAVRHIGFGVEELLKVIFNACDVAFMDEKSKRLLKKRIIAELDEVFAMFGEDRWMEKYLKN